MLYRKKEDAPSSVKAELVDFCETTSLVGLAHVVGERFRWSRLLWLLAFLGAVAAAIYQVQFLIKKFQRYPINTAVSFENSKLQPFPFVTICNLNPLQKTKVEDSEDKLLRDLFNFYQYPGDFNKTQKDDLFGKEPEIDCSGFSFQSPSEEDNEYDYDYDGDDNNNNNGDPCFQYEDDEAKFALCDECKWKDGGGKQDSGEKAKDLLREKITQMSYAQLKNVSQEKEEMVVSCTFGGKACSATDFKYVRNPRYGRCIDFAWKRNSTFTGPAYGLQLVLNLNLDEYTFASNVGARLELHSQGTTSYPYGNGIYVSAGQMNSIGMSKLQINRMGLPYGDCINIEDDEDLKKNYPHIATLKKNYNLAKSYTVADCESICKYETIKNEAKCIVRESPHAHKNKKDAEGKTLPNCTPQNREDVKSATNYYESTSSCGIIFPEDLPAHKKCPQQCTQSSYLTEISSAVYPADVNFNDVADMLRKDPRLQEDFLLPKRDDDTLDRNWYVDNQYFNETEQAQFEKKVKQNLVRVNIFFKDLNFQKVQQEAGYDFIALVSDLGGNTGLWVGFCVLTIIEWIVLIINCCYAVCCSKKKSGRASPTNNAKEEKEMM